MSVRLIACDLDNTLLGADRRLSAYTASVLTKVASVEGLTLLAVTGRSRWALELALGDCRAIDYAICSNGAIFYRRSTKQVERRRMASRRQYAELHRWVHQHIDGACWAWDTEGGIVPDEEFRALGTQRGKELDELIASPRLTLAGSPDAPLEERLAAFNWIARGLLARPEMTGHDLAERLGADMADWFCSSSAPFLEVTPPKVHKASALIAYCFRHDINASEVVAFGDQLNDLRMLQWAGRGIAMANSPQGVLAEIPEHTEFGHDADGAAIAIEDIIANR